MNVKFTSRIRDSKKYELMMKHELVLVIILVLFEATPAKAELAPVWDGLGNPTADQVLDDRLGFARPNYTIPTESGPGFNAELLGEVPEPGIHPRVLFGPSQIPDVRSRLVDTKFGQAIGAAMQKRLAKGFDNPDSLTGKCIEALVRGNQEEFEELYGPVRAKGQPEYNKTPVLFDLEVALFDALINDKPVQGERAGRALAAWARQLEPRIDGWRAGPAGEALGRWGSYHALGAYAQFAWHELGLAYDFGAPFMSEDDRSDVRRVISKLTKGVYVFGMNLPPHLRSWNWINCGSYFVLLSLAIEGEEGYDPRVYDRSVEMLTDYLHTNYSAAGSSTEPVGYTSFGYVWGAEALVALARRGDNLLISTPYVKAPEWQVQCMAPYGEVFHSMGDGGSNAPTFDELHLRKAFYPEDALTDYLFQQVSGEVFNEADRYFNRRGRPFLGSLLATDPSDTDYDSGAKLDLPTTWADPERGTLITRTGWSAEATKLHIESRPDSFYAGHEHADRGHFILSSHGRTWAPDGFRSVESRYHSIVLIDGKGQGYFPTPSEVLNIRSTAEADFLTCDQSYAYDWFYPKAIVGVDPNAPKFDLERFAHFRQQAIDFQERFPDFMRDDHPNVVQAFEGYPLGDSGMWDEDPWTVKAAHNPVEYAFRTAGLVKGEHPYVLIVDDIKKDDDEHLYEWLMMLEMDLIPLAITLYDDPVHARHFKPSEDTTSDSVYTDILIGIDGTPSSKPGYYFRYHPKKGDLVLLVRVLEARGPEPGPAFSGSPQPRVETFEKKDFCNDFGGRSFDLDKRLVVPSRSVTPNFKILLYPHRYGDPLPRTDYEEGGDGFNIRIGNQHDRIDLGRLETGRTALRISRDGQVIADTH